ncbi:MAG: hypothetical protein IT381_25770 [Deltaproteobacteria bacterium]|nr:hypothetical protein [Deltaproteobacteria bacterium]
MPALPPPKAPSATQAAKPGADRQLGDLISKCLSASPSKERIAKDALIADAPALERVLKALDATIVQRILRDTLRMCPATAALGPNALKLLSSLADALDHAVASAFVASVHRVAGEALVPVRAAAQRARAELTAHLAKGNRALDAELKALDALAAPLPADVEAAGATAVGAYLIPERLRVAAAQKHGFDPQVRATGYLGDLYRRAKLVPAKSPFTDGLAALNVIAEALLAAAPATIASDAKTIVLLRPLSKAPAPAPGQAPARELPPLKPEEVRAVALRMFDVAAPPKDLLKPVLAGAFPQARTLLSMRGEALVRRELRLLCEAAIAEPGPPSLARSNLRWTARYFAESDPSPYVSALYAAAKGDGDQKARQIGFFLAMWAMEELKPWRTPEAVRAAFERLLTSVARAAA